MSIPTKLLVLDGDDWKVAFTPEGDVYFNDHGHGIIDGWKAVGIEVEIKEVWPLENYDWEFSNTIANVDVSAEVVLEFWNREPKDPLNR